MRSAMTRWIEEAENEARRRVAKDRQHASEDLHPLLDKLVERLYDIDGGELQRNGLTPRRIRDQFKAEIGLPVGQYLIRLKQSVAEWLLGKTSLRSRDVALALGYGERPENFSRDFKRWTRQSPLAFRKSKHHPPINIDWRAELFESFEPSDLPRAKPLLIYSGGPEAEELAELIWNVLRNEPPKIQQRALREKIVFGHRALFDQIVSASREEGRSDRKRGPEIAGLLMAFIEGSGRLLGPETRELRVLAHCWLGNAQRLAGDFESAEKCFREARAQMKRAGLGEDPRLNGQVDLFIGTLRVFERRFVDARRHLDLAVEQARVSRDTRLEIQSRLQRASTGIDEGRPARAAPDLRAVLALMDRQSSPSLRDLVGVSQNLALVYVEADQIEDAEVEIRKAKTICTEIDDATSRFTLHWISGLLAQAKDKPLIAEEEFRRARKGFIELNDPYSTALVALDLAIICHLEDRREETHVLVKTDVLPLLESFRLDQECFASLHLLKSAIRAEGPSLRALREARVTLRRSASRSVP